MADKRKEIVGGLGRAAKRLFADRPESVAGVHYADPLAPSTMRMSEALGNVGAEGKTLNFTEADRSRVFGTNRGGVGFSALQHYSEPHWNANTVWGFGNDIVAKKKIKQNDPDKSLWTTFVGAPTQHKSNTVVIQDAVKEFQKAAKQGKVHPAQIKLINDRIKLATDDQSGVFLFDPSYDLTDPKGITQHEGQASEAAALKAYAKSKGHPTLADALKYEGEQLQHCVGGYCPDVISGKSRIFSLRDAKGNPHATIEVEPSKTLTPEKREAQMGFLVQRLLGEGMSEEKALQQAAKLYPESETMQSIHQIKGRGNRAPSEEYLPYVQDFVRSGKWSDVKDLKNTGLIREGDELMTPSEHADWLLKQLNAPPEGMAEGGAAFKTLQWSKPQHFDDGGVVPSQKEMEDALRPATVNPMMARAAARRSGEPMIEGTEERWETIKKNAKEMYEEAKTELGSDYKRLRDSPAARAQLAKIWAAGNAGGGPDFLNFINEYVLDPIKSVTVDKVFTKPSSVMSPLDKRSQDIGYERKRVPKFDSIASVLTTESGVPNPLKGAVISGYPYDNDEPDIDAKLKRIPLGGSEHMIERMQARDMMYGGKQTITDPHTGQQTEINTGRFHPIIEIGGSILTGGGLNAAAKSARNVYRRLTEPERIRNLRASTLSRAINEDLETFTKKPLPRKRGGLAQLNTR